MLRLCRNCWNAIPGSCHCLLTTHMLGLLLQHSIHGKGSMHVHNFRGGSCLPCGVQPSRTEHHLLVLRINLHYTVILIINGENKISIGLNDLCPDIEF
jgi:hypothetical protein